jgi:hypothetical protein
MPTLRHRWIEKNADWQAVQTWKRHVAAALAVQAVAREWGLPGETLLLTSQRGEERFAIITRHHPECSGTATTGGRR